MLTKKDNTKSEAKPSKTTKSPIASTSEAKSCCAGHSPSTASPTKTPQPHKQHSETVDKKTNSSKTHITVKFDAGYPNQLFIRGKGANLSWEKGQPLKNTQPDEWVWETEAHFTTCEFKILINDRVYENGDNHHLNAGSAILLTPQFY